MTADQMYEKVLAGDSSYNGKFYTGVLTTGIYCLPSCSARKPKRENVRFFSTPEEAEAVGLRACKICKPKEHGLFLEEQRLERVVADLRANPAGMPSADHLARELGCGKSRLNELFRHYYHTTPASMLVQAKVSRACTLLQTGEASVASVAFDVGYESTSAFYEAFARLTGMSPAAYRDLRGSSEFQLTLPHGYAVSDLKRYLGRDPASPSHRLCGSTYYTSFQIDGQGLAVRMELGDTSARVQYSGNAFHVHDRMVRLLGFAQDVRGFVSLASADPALAPLLPGGCALRIPQTPTVWEGVLWALIGQQVNLRFAAALKARLTEKYGTPVMDCIAPPSPESLAYAVPEDLVPLQFSRRKAEYLIGIAQLASAGTLQVEKLLAEPATKVERTLLALRGFGPWSANYLMMRSCGFADCTPLGDTGLTSGLQNLFVLEVRPDASRTQELMKSFAPYRSLATYHLWNLLSTPT